MSKITNLKPPTSSPWRSTKTQLVLLATFAVGRSVKRKPGRWDLGLALLIPESCDPRAKPPLRRPVGPPVSVLNRNPVLGGSLSRRTRRSRPSQRMMRLQRSGVRLPERLLTWTSPNRPCACTLSLPSRPSRHAVVLWMYYLTINI